MPAGGLIPNFSNGVSWLPAGIISSHFSGGRCTCGRGPRSIGASGKMLAHLGGGQVCAAFPSAGHRDSSGPAAIARAAGWPAGFAFLGGHRNSPCPAYLPGVPGATGRLRSCGGPWRKLNFAPYNFAVATDCCLKQYILGTPEVMKPANCPVLVDHMMAHAVLPVITRYRLFRQRGERSFYDFGFCGCQGIFKRCHVVMSFLPALRGGPASATCTLRSCGGPLVLASGRGTQRSFRVGRAKARFSEPFFGSLPEAGWSFSCAEPDMRQRLCPSATASRSDSRRRE